MLKLEKYKLFKRKMVLVLMIGIFLIVLLQEIRAFRIYKNMQQQIEISEKYKGIYTDSRFSKYWKEYSQAYDGSSAYKPYFLMVTDKRRQRNSFQTPALIYILVLLRTGQNFFLL